MTTYFIAWRPHDGLQKSSQGKESEPEAGEEPLPDDGIVTTEEEFEGFHIVKSILREVVDLERVVSRDTKSYFGILFDDNNRKPICRLHFNGPNNYLGLFDEKKKETRVPLEKLDDIYEHAEQLRAKVKHYLETATGPQSRPSRRLEKPADLGEPAEQNQ